MNEQDIVSICPSFRQLVLKPTRKNKTLTIVVTDLHRFFQEPSIVPPVPVDDGAQGVPSDHQGVLVVPLNNSAPKKTSCQTISIRPIKESSLKTFGQEMVLEDWSFLDDPGLTPTGLVEAFQMHSSHLIDKHFPLKTVTVSSHDLPFFNERLRMLKRQRQSLQTFRKVSQIPADKRSIQ